MSLLKDIINSISEENLNDQDDREPAYPYPATNICPDCEGSGKIETRTAHGRPIMDRCERCYGVGEVFENAAVGSTGANAMASVPALMFNKKRKMIRRSIPTQESNNHFVNYSRTLTKEGTFNKGGILNLTKIREKGQSQLQYAMSLISEDITGATDFDVADVLSKLEAAEKKAKVEKDTVTFGLENEDGGIVRVYVRKDQADDFEQALSQLLAGSDNNNDDENTSMEIAEVLFKLKDRYDIVDVDWGDIPEDEEQEQTVDDGNQQPPPENGGQEQPGEENPIDQAAGEEGTELPSEDNTQEKAKSALDSVIDLMKADAKAKQAEADARAAEARAKEAEWTAKAASAKVKQEEKILDMETHEKEIKQQDKEAKTLAKLAKYEHDKATKYSGELHGAPDVDTSEEEESGGTHVPFDPKLKYKGSPNNPERVSLEQLRDLIFYHLKGVNK